MKKIKTLLKNYSIFYFIYNRTFSFLLKIIGFFCRTNEKLILFNSYGGAKFGDSPKCIYDYMISSNKYKDYILVWALDNPKLVGDKNVNVVKNNTPKFFITALKAKYWITNSSMERGLKFKKKQTIYINTWHGTALKKMGKDINTSNPVAKFKTTPADILYVQGQYDINFFVSAYNFDKNTMRLVGLPRNDELCNVKEEEVIQIKKKLNLPLDKKIILYAPTFREYNYDINGCFIAPPIDIKKWESKLSKDYIVLFRAHYEVNKVLNIENNGFIYNYTDYPSLNDLLKISDILISDYSSIMVDYSILERPIYAYTYDYEEYIEKRGMYVDLKKVLPNGIQEDEDSLLEQICSCNFKEQKAKTKKFKDKFVEKCGSATKYIDEIILKND